MSITTAQPIRSKMEGIPLFENRRDAGQKLAKRLLKYAHQPQVLVLGLPRGGVPVAFEVAKALDAPLDIFLVRKLGVPGHEELAMGAIASGGVRVLNQALIRSLEIPPQVIAAITQQEQQELERREHAYRGNRPKPNLANRTVLLVDDGLATGASMRAAVLALREQHPARIVVAVPTAAPDACIEFAKLVDEMICAETPDPFWGVGMWYYDFSPTNDEEVRALLAEAHGVMAVTSFTRDE
ncbi:MAG: phosphoribosyltransferase [Caldilineaceae bacterium]